MFYLDNQSNLLFFILNRLDAAVEQLREVHQERLSAAVNDMAANQAAAAAAAAAATKNSTEDQNAGEFRALYLWDRRVC